MNNIYMILFLFLHEVCKYKILHHSVILFLIIYISFLNTMLIIFLTGEHNCTVAHEDQVLTVKEGGNVLLPCVILDDQLHRALWYKEVLGEKPVLIVSSYHHSQPNEFSPDFEANRFHAVRKDDKDDKSFNLTILRTLKSDSGTYFCGAAFANIISFNTGIVLLVKGEGNDIDLNFFRMDNSFYCQVLL